MSILKGSNSVNILAVSKVAKRLGSLTIGMTSKS
jgi:phosphoheptose isomerase